MILIDGQPGDKVSALDRGLHYGDGVFETIAIINGMPLCLDAHLRRLRNGCRVLGISAPETQILSAEVRQITAGTVRAVLKIIVTRGAGGRGYQPPPESTPVRILSIHPWPDYPADHRSSGVEAAFCDFVLARQPALAGIKHLNRLEQVLARAEVAGRKCPEGFVSDPSGAIIEGTMSNVFMRRGNLLITPGLQDCGVAGIIRAEIIDRAAGLGLETRVQRIDRADLLAAEEVFFSNSIIGIWPVRRAGAHQYRRAEIAPGLDSALVEAGCIVPP